MVVALVGGLAFATALVEGLTVNSALVDEQVFIDQGRYVLLIEPDPDRGALIDAAACERLASLDGVVQSGAEFSTLLLATPSYPGSRITASVVTRGNFQLLASGERHPVDAPSNAGAVLGESAAERFGIGTNSSLMVNGTTGTQSLAIVSTVGELKRSTNSQDTVFDIVAASGGAKRCAVELTPAMWRYLGNKSVVTLETLGPEPTIVSPLFSVPFEPANRYHERIGRWLPLAAATLTVLLLEVAALGRRTEMALYRALGTPRSALAFMLYLEHLLFSACAAAAALAGLSLVSTHWYASAIDHALVALVATLLLGPALRLPLMFLGRRNIMDSLKDR